VRTIVLANQKGGGGKTATAVITAFYLREKFNKKILFIDSDTQANASLTLKNYRSQEINSYNLFVDDCPVIEKEFLLLEATNKLADIEQKDQTIMAENFKMNLEKYGPLYDICIIDTPPAISVKLYAALMAADFVLSPIELEVYSLQGIKLMLSIINNIKADNKNLQFLGMLACKVDGRNPRHEAHFTELTAAYPGLMLPFKIGLRSSIPDSLASGTPLWKIRKSAAAAAKREMLTLVNFLLANFEK
jgi:chromosome partitioning protein